ncbi:MAG: HNH endonuclease [Planctomycetota bacterium]
MTVLGQPTLVLNKSWVAITTTTVRRAMSLLFIGAARVVSPGSYETHDFESWLALDVDDNPDEVPQRYIQAVSRRVRVPDVIQLVMFNGMPRTQVAFSRRNLFRRDNNQCQYCGSRPGTADLTIDHVVPRSAGGPSSWDNCVLACTRCNRKKGNRTPVRAGMALRRPPRMPAWAPHLDVASTNRRETWDAFLSEGHRSIEMEMELLDA